MWTHIFTSCWIHQPACRRIIVLLSSAHVSYYYNSPFRSILQASWNWRSNVRNYWHSIFFTLLLLLSLSTWLHISKIYSFALEHKDRTFISSRYLHILTERRGEILTGNLYLLAQIIYQILNKLLDLLILLFCTPEVISNYFRSDIARIHEASY